MDSSTGKSKKNMYVTLMPSTITKNVKNLNVTVPEVQNK